MGALTPWLLDSKGGQNRGRVSGRWEPGQHTQDVVSLEIKGTDCIDKAKSGGGFKGEMKAVAEPLSRQQGRKNGGRKWRKLKREGREAMEGVEHAFMHGEEGRRGEEGMNMILKG